MNTVIVTGGTKGLGFEIVKKLTITGFKVIAISRKESDQFVELREKNQEQISFKPYDLSETGGIHDLVNEVVKEHGAPWGLVNNAGIGLDGVLATQHDSEIHKLLTVNLESPILLAKYIGRIMLTKKAGRIINVTSIIASTGYRGLTVYAATKGGLESFTRSLAREIGKYTITVNNIAPGYMETEMTEGLNSDQLASITRRTALGRLPFSNDVAASVAFLLSQEASSITGTTLTIDAGSTA